MQSFPWLILLIAWPVLGAVILWLSPGLARASRAVALAWSLVELGLAATMAVAWAGDSGPVRLAARTTWIPQFGTSLAVGLTGVALTMVLLSVVLVPLVLLAARKEQADHRRASNYAALILILEAFMVAVFAARDIFLFYVLFEAMLIPVYFLIGSFGGANRKPAALKFLVYSLAGGLAMLAGVIGYFAKTGGETAFWLDGDVVASLSPTGERLIFLAFFIAFAIKAPMFPVHTWLPDAAQAAKPGTSVLLVGVLDKVGTFGMITLCLPLFPNAVRWAAPVVVALAVISVIWGALMALAQKDILRMIAYTSVSHFGFIVLGIFAFTTTSEIGASFYMVNHGLSTGALFLLAGFLINRRGTQRIDQMGPGLQRVAPVLAGTFLVVGLSAVALPGLSTFVSEFSVIVGTFQTWPVAAVIAVVGVILAALYILITYQKIFTGKSEDLNGTADLSSRERWVVAPLIAAMLALGVYPAPALDVLRLDANAAALVEVSDIALITSSNSVVAQRSVEIFQLRRGYHFTDNAADAVDPTTSDPASTVEGSNP